MILAFTPSPLAIVLFLLFSMMKKLLLFVTAALPVFGFAQSPLTGVSLSPEGFPYTFSNLPAFFTEVTQACPGSVVYGNGGWYDADTLAGNVPGFASLLTGNTPTPYNYTDMITLGWGTWPNALLSPQGGVNDWTNSTTRALFLQTCARTADQHPAYLFVGNEVSFYLEDDSLDYPNWISLYSQAYDTIKAHSPQTKVGTVFNYEHISGNGHNMVPQWMGSHWHALMAMDTSKMDVVGISSYPFLQYDSANVVPNSYYQPLFDSIGNKPVVITETGWPADDFGISPWPCSPQLQLDYINKLSAMTAGHNVEAMNWLFQYYLMDYSNSINNLVFCSVSLYDSTGVPRPALSAWQSHCAVLGEPSLQTTKEWTITAQPNPFTTTTQLLIDDPQDNQSVQLHLYDVNGRIVREENIGLARSIELSREGLSDGIYFFRLQNSRNETLSTGKLIIRE